MKISYQLIIIIIIIIISIIDRFEHFLNRPNVTKLFNPRCFKAVVLIRPCTWDSFEGFFDCMLQCSVMYVMYIL